MTAKKAAKKAAKKVDLRELLGPHANALEARRAAYRVALRSMGIDPAEADFLLDMQGRGRWMMRPAIEREVRKAVSDAQRHRQQQSAAKRRIKASATDAVIAEQLARGIPPKLIAATNDVKLWKVYEIRKRSGR